MKFFLLLLIGSMWAGEEFFPYTREPSSMAIDPSGNKMTAWEEKGHIWVSESLPNGSWSKPTLLSSPLVEASSPKIEVIPSGDAIVVWIEENSIKAAAKTPEGDWKPSLISPAPSSKDPSKPLEFILSGRRLVRLEPVRFKEKERGDPSIRNRGFQDKSPKINPLSTNAIDAPSTGSLRGGQIGFAAGTSAPSDGMIISGQVGIGTSSPGVNFVSISPPSPAAIPYATLIGGTLVADDGFNEQFGLLVSPAYSPNQTNTKNFFNIICQPTATLSVNSTTYNGFYHQPTIATTGSNFSLTNFYGIRMIAPSKTGGGTISNAYNGFFVAPTIASANVALYADNGSIGFTGVTPPTNGLIVSGQVALNMSSAAAGTRLSMLDSSSVPASEQGAIQIRGTLTSFPSIPRLCFGINYTASVQNYGWIQAVDNGRALVPLILQGEGGGGAQGVTIGTTTTPGSTLDLSGNLTVGASYVGTAAPTNGAIIQGATSIGSSSITSGTRFQVQAATTDSLGCFVGGTMSTDSSSIIRGLVVGPLMQPTNNNVNVYGTAYSVIIDANGNTIPIAYSLNASMTTTLSGLGGSITTGYTGYFAAPTGSNLPTNRTALYTDDLCVGYTATTPPTNGAIISGSVGIGVSSLTGAASPGLEVAGHIVPHATKTYNIGDTGVPLRWNQGYFANTINVGNARLAPVRTRCPLCNKAMLRGAGTFITIGEAADYIPIFCPDCGTHKIEAMSHFPEEKRALMRPAPQIVFLGFFVSQNSPNSRSIQVRYSYGDQENATSFSDVEYEEFLAMDKGDQRAFLKKLGQREWETLEENRIMREECVLLQTTLDEMGKEWKDTDLLK